METNAAKLDTPVSERVFQVDASLTGFAAVETTAARTEITKELTFTNRRGWVVAVDEWFTTTEALSVLDDEGGREGFLPPYPHRELTRCG